MLVPRGCEDSLGPYLQGARQHWLRSSWGPVQNENVGSLSISRWQQQSSKPCAACCTSAQVTQHEASPGAWRVCSEVGLPPRPGWAGLEQHTPVRRVTSNPTPLPVVLWPVWRSNRL